MGVPGLWDLVRPAAVRTSLHALSRDAFLANKNGLRALTIGVDASIWIFHAQTNRNGANAFLRTIFYKIAALLQHPVLPVFVFDGPKKPSMKRGHRVMRSFGVNDGYSRQFKDLLDVCGLEWWNAPGEAEAELALMNRQGKIDAVLSDDVDALLFGATCLLRNNSPTLSGAQASSTQNTSSRSDQRHYEMYRISDIVAEWTRDESALKNADDCQRAMVLVALLGGGDYVPEGVGRMGPKISFGLAKAGHADFLKLYTKERSRFDRKIAQVHDDILNELSTNSSGHIGRRMKKLAEDLTDADLFQTFPLDCYLNPAISPSDDPGLGWPGFGKGEVSSSRGKARNIGRGDLEGMARACERYFEWGTREIVCKKFAGDTVNLFGAEIVSEARSMSRASTETRRRPTCRPGESPERITSYFTQSSITTSQGRKSISTTGTRHLVKIHSTRPSPMCSGLTEYRLEYQPKCYMDRCREAMDGHRADPSTLSPEERVTLGLVGEAAAPADTAIKDEVRIWIADYLVRAAWPHLITKYDEQEAAKTVKKAAPKKKAAVSSAGKGRKKAATKAVDAGAFEDFFASAPATQLTVRQVEQVTAGGTFSRRRRASATASSSHLTPAPSCSPRSMRSSSDLTAAQSSPLSLPPSSPIPVPAELSLPSPPVSPSKRGRSMRSQIASSRSSLSRDTSPCPGSPVATPLPTRRSPRKKRVTAPRAPRSVCNMLGSAADPICVSSDEDEQTPQPMRTSRAANRVPTAAPDSPVKRGTKAGRGRVATTEAGACAANISPPARHTRTDARQPTVTVPVRTLTTSVRRVSPHCTPSIPTTAITHTPTQTRLDLMTVARARKSQPAKKATSVSEPRSPRLPYFVVSEDDDGVEHIDLTQPRPRGSR
ncbi:hypothetical protein CcaverHIS002_0601530 [Cutaneotrichosporon cavernicola]|uniref:XPG-I domain-containing protein n=1 Tax=Cutaneotrichosporon cavernicola TaxID=279322 RepID=A0AA48QWM8_9TREE|nr:uncharacterized protein CcaverHIS019_0501630 [Cutaneotrichosporon cavernicola]BEI85866.1 hypothetical protein CcaverHIS002_0601530 [Cutaneotrichosporon cavernicola]BEI92535.1 hypothetical protein CcaverHIS019_0501630 [Cutaneotrichosporon cavernicola]BEJ00308.1 hypothetical protein CcaverHIS631_0501650 [Cutaneotrichosporon cavernicola]BEJ08078.1 hypothetical protein CcaverHIS641_0501630 [Cutaneotrichosporon cavernicola]